MKDFLRIATTPATGPSEIIMALTILSYGIGQVLFPANTLISWTAFLIFVGVARVVTVWRFHYQARLWATLASIFIWLYLWIWALKTPPASPRIVTFFTWFMIECWTIFRIRRTS